MTALMTASMLGSPEVVRELLLHNASVDLQGETGCTALMLASAHNCTQVVELLLQQNANVDIQAGDGSTALTIATSINKTAIVHFQRSAPNCLSTPTSGR